MRQGRAVRRPCSVQIYVSVQIRAGQSRAGQGRAGQGTQGFAPSRSLDAVEDGGDPPLSLSPSSLLYAFR